MTLFLLGSTAIRGARFPGEVLDDSALVKGVSHFLDGASAWECNPRSWWVGNVTSCLKTESGWPVLLWTGQISQHITDFKKLFWPLIPFFKQCLNSYFDQDCAGHMPVPEGSGESPEFSCGLEMSGMMCVYVCVRVCMWINGVRVHVRAIGVCLWMGIWVWVCTCECVPFFLPRCSWGPESFLHCSPNLGESFQSLQEALLTRLLLF